MPRASYRRELTKFELEWVILAAEGLPFSETPEMVAVARRLLSRFVRREVSQLGPVAADLHRLLKMKATGEGKSLKAFLEENLGPLVEWQPEDKAQLKLEGVA